jgi:hypothetical protein
MKCSRCDGSGVEPVTAEQLALADDARRDEAIDMDASFESFWTLYGKVGPRKKARECFVAAVRRGHDPNVIIFGLDRWVTYWQQPGAAAMKWPQGFLNQEYFLDAPPPINVPTQRKAMPGRAGIEAALARTQRKAIGS